MAFENEIDRYWLMNEFDLGIGFTWNSDGTVFASQTLLVEQLIEAHYKSQVLRESTTPMIERMTIVDEIPEKVTIYLLT